jgi:hypothetical protein
MIGLSDCFNATAPAAVLSFPKKSQYVDLLPIRNQRTDKTFHSFGQLESESDLEESRRSFQISQHLLGKSDIRKIHGAYQTVMPGWAYRCRLGEVDDTISHR